jgi:hypothetical protein
MGLLVGIISWIACAHSTMLYRYIHIVSGFNRQLPVPDMVPGMPHRSDHFQERAHQLELIQSFKQLLYTIFSSLLASSKSFYCNARYHEVPRWLLATQWIMSNGHGFHSRF